MRPILVIGGMNMDILGLPEGELSLRESSIGHVLMRPGGVGRNIAQQLAALGAPVELMTVLGSDAFSQALETSCEKLGIGLQYALRTGHKACVYLALHDAQGDMLAALNDMAAMDALDAASIRASLPQGAFSACVLDANLSQEALIAAAAHIKAPLIADPVSSDKALRLRPILHQLTALKPNLQEARRLSGRQSPQEAAAALLDIGVKQVFISLGAQGLYYASASASGLLPALKVPLSPATGAGDAMVAGLSLAIARGLDTQAAAIYGRQCATDHLINSSADAQPNHQ